MSFSFRDHFDALNRGEPGATPALPPEVEADGPIPDELVDRMLDGEVDPAKAREVLGAIRRDREASKRLDSTQRIFRVLKTCDREMECPDFSERVLAQVAARSGLFSRAGLRKMLAYRYAAAAAVLFGIGSLFVAQRMAPETMRLTPQAAPVSQLVHSVPTETAGLFSGVRSAFSSLAGAVPTVSPSPLAVRRLCELNSSESGCGFAKVNPPLAAILWMDESPKSGGAVCKGRRCADRPVSDSWVTVGGSYNGILLDDVGPRAGDSDVVFVTLGR
ncbi:MAG: hypothetical protein JNK58_13940 [Phycisphaerae bacterium]|nr:hypothetical protein [Phycisphaerae bacterium]